jgi:hypothetical protein
MAAPVVQVLWVTSGVWAITDAAALMNKSDASINRNAVFIFSLLYDSYLKILCGADSWSPTHPSAKSALGWGTRATSGAPALVSWHYG